jgi:hypothetical protein
VLFLGLIATPAFPERTRFPYLKSPGGNPIPLVLPLPAFFIIFCISRN